MSRRELSKSFNRIERIIHWRVVSAAESLTSGDAKDYLHIDETIDGYNLYHVAAAVDDPSSSSGISLQLYSMGDSSDILSTPITISSGDYSSKEAASQPVINPTYRKLATGDRLRADVDANGNGAKGLVYHLGIRNY